VNNVTKHNYTSTICLGRTTSKCRCSLCKPKYVTSSIDVAQHWLKAHLQSQQRDQIFRV